MSIVAVNVNSSIIKILIVDDSPLIVDRLVQALGGVAEVEIVGVARNVNSAFSLVKQHLPRVVILDIYLEDDAPAANGLTLLAVLAEGFPQIQVIMLTNLSGPQYKNKCLQMGARYFLDKTNEFERVPEILIDIINESNGKHEWPA